MPDAIDHHPRRERIGRVDHTFGEIKSATGIFRRNGLVNAIDGLHESPRNDRAYVFSVRLG